MADGNYDAIVIGAGFGGSSCAGLLAKRGLHVLRLGATPSETPELIEVAGVVEDTISLLHWEAELRDVTVGTTLEPGARVMASDSEMRMVLLNLVQNAFHAMPQGGDLHVASRTIDGRIEITVQDSGIGIQPDKLKKVFDPFYSRRADGSQGTGLGLSIVRTIVENYGGEVSVQSEPGQGSRLAVSLPDASVTAGDAI